MTKQNGQMIDQVGTYIKRANTEMGEVDTRVRHLVEQRPLAALLGAIAAGFVLARIAARAS